MKRLALIIGCQGDRVPLAGVPKDVNNMAAFLSSPDGGSWKSSEIIISNPNTADEVTRVVSNAKIQAPDYGLIYFTGHGGINSKNNRMVIEIRSGEDVYADLITFSRKELAIFDTCRSFFTPTGTTTESRMFAEHQDSAKLDTSVAFNQRITACEIGRIEMYSSSIGEPSNDTGRGGLFTVKLLESAIALSTNTNSNIPVDCTAPFFIAKKKVETEKKEQHPSIEGSIRRQNFFPFAMGVKSMSNPYFR